MKKITLITIAMNAVSSWAGSPEVTLVSEGGSQVKVHRMLLGLYSDQWRLTLQGLEINQLVFILQGDDGLQLGRLVSEIYKAFTESDSEVEDDVEKISVITRTEKINEYDETDDLRGEEIEKHSNLKKTRKIN